MPSITRLDKSIRRRPVTPNANWTLAEITTLRDLAAAGATSTEIATALGRSRDGVASVAKRRGIVTGSARVMTANGETVVRHVKPTFASLIGSRRFEDDRRSLRPQPAGTVYRPATYVRQVGYLG